MNLVRNLILTIALVGVVACAAVLAQAPPREAGPGGVAAPPVAYPAPSGTYWYESQRTSPYGAGDAQLARDYVKAEKEDAKKEIRKKLADSLAKQFDQHLQQQQKELDDLEKQIASLKELVKKRQAVKNDIIERRLEQLLREAEGLGWNAPSSPRVPGGVGYGGFAPAARPEKIPPGSQNR